MAAPGAEQKEMVGIADRGSARAAPAAVMPPPGGTYPPPIPREWRANPEVRNNGWDCVTEGGKRDKRASNQ